MAPFDRVHTFHWMLPRRSPRSWSMTCLTRFDFSRLGRTVSLRQPPKQRKAEHPRVAVCGERVGLLWAEGKTDAAIRLEQLCNDLVKKHTK